MIETRKALVDDEARRRISEDLGGTLVVEAAAGTGKTTMLVARIVAALRTGTAKLDAIVAVTFTEKAAGEMKLRLRAEIERARTSAESTAFERELLDQALAQLEFAKIGTIHALCADLLRERPVEARVDPLFEVCAEDDARHLFDLAFERWFQAALADPPEGVRRMLRRRPRGRGQRGPRDQLRDAAWQLAGHRDFSAAWQRDPLDRNGWIDRLLERLAHIAAFAGRADRDVDWLEKNFQKVKLFLDELARREAVRPRDHDGLEAELADLAYGREWGYTGGRGQSYGKGLKRADLVKERDEVKADLDAFLLAAGADLAACLQAELEPIIGAYTERKSRSGKLDFLDLLLGARDLVKQHADVRAELQRRTSHLFVDEFQDTDPLQAEILMLLAADDPNETSWTRARPIPGKLFLVGDPKQSIYRFRRAEVALYQNVKDRLLSQGAELLHLVTSFRSAPSIQSAVNAAFAPVMQKSLEGTQAEYVALEPFRDDIAGQPAVIALPVPRPYSDKSGKVTSWAISSSLPDAVGAFVAWLVEKSGFRVSERGSSEPVPVQARHVCLLFKRFQSFGEDATRDYVRALEGRRILHVLVGGRSFHGREEVQAMTSALSAVEWPDDELAVFATLRGPFLALSDDALFAYRAAFGLSPLRRVEDEKLTELTRPVAQALAVLRELHLRRNHRPIADTVTTLLEVTRAHAGIAIWPSGEQALANVLRVTDLARRFEARGATSFRAFVERMRDDEGGQAGEAPVVEEGTDGVRIMTVHRAKGLEFPVVILADPTTPSLQGLPSRHVDPEKGLWAEPLVGLMPADLASRKDDVLRRDREESVRLAYVGATRARDLLVIPACGDEEIEGWLDVMHPVIYPPREAFRFAAEAPGCPPFGDDSVLERPDRSDKGSWASVMPGLHVPRAGSHRVVWWDPRALNLGVEHEGGLRQQRILQADEQSTLSFEGKVAHEAWRDKRYAITASGALPTLRVRTATEVAADVTAGFTAVQNEIAAKVDLDHTSAAREGRPHGRRFGSLVHAVLADVDLDADADRVRIVAAAQGRLANAPPDEIDAAAAAAVAALEHPLLAKARAAAALGACRRETPLLLALDDGAIVEGVVDLAFRDQGTWIVVDFKTDAELGDERRTAYARQVALYCHAITKTTGEPSRGVLLAV